LADDLERKPWDREPGEPMVWFNRFEFYRLLGPDRSIQAAIRAYKTAQGKPPPRGISKPWPERSRTWRWKERAEAWDAAEIERIRREFDDERRKDKQRRIKVLRAFRGKLEQALVGLEPYSARWQDVTSGLAMVMPELRREYGDAPEENDTGALDITIEWADAPTRRYDEPEAVPEGGDGDGQGG